MTNDTTKSSAARTDDLLASGADAKDGARGFDNQAGPQALQTGMEGIGGGNRQSESHKPDATSKTLPDNAGQLRNEQKS